ncbi:MAG: glycosyltransferase family 39 protein [Terriglobales bacterium]
MSQPSPSSRWTSGPAIVGYIAAFTFLLHVYADKNYGYFVDELYFIACSKHLALGYVDMPPLLPFVLRIERTLFGDGLHAIRFLSAVAAAINVVFAGWMAREFGGRRFAQVLAALCVLVAPLYLGIDSYISMNSLEPLFWMGCALLFIRIVKTGNQKLWLWFGVLAGVGLNNKYSMGFFGLGLVIGLLLTRHRRMFLQKWIWLGGVIAFALILPNLIWQAEHHFPFAQLMANIARSHRNVALAPGQFVWQQIQAMLPLTFPIWLAGLVYLFADREGRRFAPLAWTYLFILFAMITAPNGRTYYVAPAYPMLFAAGAVAFDLWLSRPRLAWIKPVYAVALVAFGAFVAPITLPILPTETYIRYSQATHLQQPRIENHDLGPLPQFYADMFGWEEMVQVVARAYDSLPPEERSRTAIVTSNYGQAGAIDLFGKKYGLPNAISSHQNYFYWADLNQPADAIIDVGEDYDHLTAIFREVQPAGQVYHPYSMPYEHFTIYICRGLKYPLKDVWRPHWD